MINRCCLTNDVETTSIVNGGLREETGEKVWKEGIPQLLDLYAKYDVKATFFYIARFAKRCPEIVTMVHKAGHEVALHGLTHEHTKSFDSMPFEEQLSHLRQGKAILEDIIGEPVVSFRSPALRVNADTPKALMDAGFKFDSSVAPQRMDMFMSLGASHKMAWLKAPRQPYYTDVSNLARIGNSSILEVPVSSFAAPYIGTLMRISPTTSRLLRNMLYAETKNTEKVINFLIHPNEIIEEERLDVKLERRSSNYLVYLLADVLRHKMKQKNLGKNALLLYEDEIRYWKRKGYAFQTIKQITV